MTENKTKKEEKKVEKNHKERRADKSWARRAKMRMKKGLASMNSLNRSQTKRKSLLKKAEDSRKKREKRDEARKKIAKKEGVNWKRVVLLSKIGAEGELKYSIKKPRKNKYDNK